MIIKRMLFLVLLFCLNVVTGCTSAEREKTPLKAPQNPSMDEYCYANSTDIYSLTGRYCIDGTKKKELWLEEPYEYSILEVNDSWLYYYEYDDEETGELKRIPLHKGEDGRDVLDIENKEMIRDTRHENGLAIVGNYYVGISYGTVAVLYDMETKKTIRQKIPEQLQYPKKMETEDKQWAVWEQGENWVIWEGENGFFIHKIPSGEVFELKIDKNFELISKFDNNSLILTDGPNCYVYDIQEMKTKKLFGKEKISMAICQGLKISEHELESFIVDYYFRNETRYFLQIDVKSIKDGKVEKKKIMLSQDINESDNLSYDNQMNQIMKQTEPEKDIDRTREKSNCEFIINVDHLWFIKNSKRYFCYNETTGILKKIDRSSPEWNVYYAVSEHGLEDGWL